jgi:hypothetical protein
LGKEENPKTSPAAQTSRPELFPAASLLPFSRAQPAKRKVQLAQPPVGPAPSRATLSPRVWPSPHCLPQPTSRVVRLTDRAPVSAPASATERSPASPQTLPPLAHSSASFPYLPFFFPAPAPSAPLSPRSLAVLWPRSVPCARPRPTGQSRPAPPPFGSFTTGAGSRRTVARDPLSPCCTRDPRRPSFRSTHAQDPRYSPLNLPPRDPMRHTSLPRSPEPLPLTSRCAPPHRASAPPWRRRPIVPHTTTNRAKLCQGPVTLPETSAPSLRHARAGIFPGPCRHR